MKTDRRHRTVVVTGMGVVSPLGNTPDAVFTAMAAGRSGIRRLPAELDYGYPNPCGGYMDGAHAGDHADGPLLRMAEAAAEQAMAASALPVGEHRGGVFVASNVYSVGTHLLEQVARHRDEAGVTDLDGLLAEPASRTWGLPRWRSDAAAAVLADRYGLRQRAMTHGDACAAGGIAIGTAFRHLRSGELDVALVGGSEAMCQLVPITSFALLGALAPGGDDVATLSRPFDSGRNGFLLGEGAAFLVLEEADHAARRGAHILARIAGFHKTSEAWRITCSNPDGSSYESCMRAAIADAGMTPMDIGHVNCHGTSTTANDACEAMALKRLFGERAAMVPITANKSALGHALGASGVLEFILSVRSLETGVLLPTLNFLSGDQATSGLDVVTTARRTPVQTVMSTSFGFGGENCALVLAKDLA